MSGPSEVCSETKDTLLSKSSSASPSNTHALTQEWVYGRTPSLPVLALQDHDHQVVLYAAANVGVIYNHTCTSQRLLQGHSSNLCALCVSEDKHWIATADPSPMILVWDSYSGIPVCTLLDCHPKDGFTDLAFSKDAKLLVTLGAGPAQHVCVWDWTNNTDTPLCCSDINPDHGLQKHMMFNWTGSELLSCSNTHVLLYCLEQQSLSYSALRLWRGGTVGRGCSDGVCAADGALVQTGFHWSEAQVLTATTGGSVVVWDVSDGVTELKNKVSVHHLQEAPFTAMTVTDSYLVTGDAEGQVKFFGQHFLLLAFYSDMSLEPVSSISFSSEASAGVLQECPVRKEQLFIRNFVASCTGPLVVHVSTETDEVQMLLDEESEAIHALCCHPSRPLLATGNNRGLLKLRDTTSKQTVSRREFGAEERVTCVSYDPHGVVLAVGFSSGHVHLLDSSLRSHPKDGFSLSRHSIHLLSFSSDALYLATADSGFAVTVLRRVSEGAPWQTVGRHRSHLGPVRSLLFGLQLDSTQPRLLSLGEDRRLVEYDLERSGGASLHLLSTERVEQRAVPLNMSWYPPLSTEQFILLSTDEYKLRLINSTTYMSRKLIRGPMFGSPLQRVQVLPRYKQDQSLNYYLAFTTQNMVGLQILPADGNPFKSQAWMAHPSGVSCLSVAFDGHRVATAGVADCCVMSWNVCTQALEAAAAELGGPDMEPFYTLLDGGRHGHVFREIEDFFFFIQIQPQDPFTEQPLQISTTIPLSQVSTMMRAIGYFPTNQEIEDMVNEVKFSRYADTGQYVTDLDLEDFIKLYVNHRPALRGTAEELEQAFNLLRGDQTSLDRDQLLQLLQTQGETMTDDEVLQSFSSLLDIAEDHSENHTEDHREDLSEDLREDHRENHTEDHTEDHREDHTEDHSPPKDSRRVVPAEVSLETLAQILGFSSASD